MQDIGPPVEPLTNVPLPGRDPRRAKAAEGSRAAPAGAAAGGRRARTVRAATLHRPRRCRRRSM